MDHGAGRQGEGIGGSGWARAQMAGAPDDGWEGWWRRWMRMAAAASAVAPRPQPCWWWSMREPDGVGQNQAGATKI